MLRPYSTLNNRELKHPRHPINLRASSVTGNDFRTTCYARRMEVVAHDKPWNSTHEFKLQPHTNAPFAFFRKPSLLPARGKSQRRHSQNVLAVVNQDWTPELVLQSMKAASGVPTRRKTSVVGSTVPLLRLIVVILMKACTLCAT